MQRIIKLAREGKRAFVALNLYKVIEPVNPFLMRLSFLSKQAEWISHHQNLPFSDRGDPGLRHEKRYTLYQYILAAERLDEAIDYLEFGVGHGHSFRWWIEHNRNPESRFVGFDTFTGLPEDWGVYKRGTFSSGGHPPEIDDSRIQWVPGLFQDTLPGFLATYSPTRRKLIHLDADMYSSTLYVLTMLAPHLRQGDLLLFDEFGVPTHEFRAFTDFVSAYRIQYQVLGQVNNYLQVAIKLLADPIPDKR